MMGMMAQLLYTGNEFMADLTELVIWLVSIAGSLMVIYAVYIGYLFATATDQSKRKAVKDRLIKLISSVFIIFALATVLGVIKVNFTEIERSDDNAKVDWAKLEYEYVGMPTLTLQSGLASPFTLNPGNIRIKDGDTLTGAKFLSFSFEGSAKDDLSKLLIYQGAPVVDVNSSSGYLTYNFKCKDVGSTTYEIKMAGKDEQGNYYVRAMASFAYANYSGCFVPVYVKIVSKDPNIKIA